MPYPIQTQVFTVFLGTQEGIHSVALPSIYSSSGSRNLWIDKLGRAKKISGYAKQNSSAVTTKTGGSATMLRGLRAYRKTNSNGTITRQVLGVFDDGTNEYELRYSTDDGVVWEFIDDLGGGSVGAIPDFAQVGNTLFFADGVVAPRAWDGDALSTARPTTQSPTPTGVINTASGQLNGSYTWKLVSMNSSEERSAGSATSNVIQVQNEKADLSWTADTNTTSVSSILRVSTTATVTTGSSHGYSTGDLITIAGADQSDYNGTFSVTYDGATTFTYTVSGSPTTPATGTITATDITGYELYRTTGTGTTFYFMTFIDGWATASYTDNASDLDILSNRALEEHGDAPPTGSYLCEPHKQRLWWGRTNTYPRRVQWSDPGQPDQVGANNYLDFTDQSSVGDLLTALIGDFEGALVAFLERSIWTVSGTGEIIADIMDWDNAKSNAVTGAVSQASVVRIPAGSTYTDSSGGQVTTSRVVLAYFTPMGDIRVFDGNNDTIISTPVKETLKTFLYAQRAKIHAVHDIENGHVVWFWPGPTPVGENAECTQAVVWNYRWGVWYVWPTMPISAATIVDTSSDTQVIIAGEAQLGKGGFAYKFFSGDSFDGDDIASRWITKVIYGGGEGQDSLMAFLKRWRWLDIIAEAETDVTLTVEWMSGSSSDDAVSRGAASRSLVAVGLQLITTADPDADPPTDSSGIETSENSNIVVPYESVQKIINLEGTNGDYVQDVGCRIRISDDSTNGSWSLEGMTLGYQVLPGATRRLQG